MPATISTAQLTIMDGDRYIGFVHHRDHGLHPQPWKLWLEGESKDTERYATYEELRDRVSHYLGEVVQWLYVRSPKTGGSSIIDVADWGQGAVYAIVSWMENQGMEVTL